MSKQNIADHLKAQETRKTIQTFIYPIPFVSKQSSTIVIDISYPVGKITFKPINTCNLTNAGATSSAFQEPLMLFSSLVNNQCVGLTGIYVQTNATGTAPINGYAITMPNDVVFQYKQPVYVRGNYVFSLGSQLNGGAWPNFTDNTGTTTGNVNNNINNPNPNTDSSPNANFKGAITVQIEFEEY